MKTNITIYNSKKNIIIVNDVIINPQKMITFQTNIIKFNNNTYQLLPIHNKGHIYVTIDDIINSPKTIEIDDRTIYYFICLN
jgi:hypothetical protein